MNGINKMGKLNAHVKPLLIDLEVQCGDKAQAETFVSFVQRERLSVEGI